MIYYLDTSALVKRYVTEPGSRAVRQLVRGKSVAISRIGYAEVASAIARLAREDQVQEKVRDRILSRLDEDFAAFNVVEVRASIAKRVSQLVVQTALRAYDAIHLASALAIRERGAAVDFWSADRALVQAALDIGLKGTAVGK